MEAAGIEPASADNATGSTPSGYENQQTTRAALALQIGDSNCLSLASIDADLRELVLAWSAIPKNVRQAIVVLIRSTTATSRS